MNEIKQEEVNIQTTNNTGWVDELLTSTKKAQEEARKYISFADGEQKTLTVRYDPYNRWEEVDFVFKAGDRPRKMIEVPVIENGIERYWSIGKSNPLITEILEKVKQGIFILTIKREGEKSDTKYFIVG